MNFILPRLSKKPVGINFILPHPYYKPANINYILPHLQHKPAVMNYILPGLQHKYVKENGKRRTLFCFFRGYINAGLFFTFLPG